MNLVARRVILETDLTRERNGLTTMWNPYVAFASCLFFSVLAVASGLEDRCALPFWPGDNVVRSWHRQGRSEKCFCGKWCDWACEVT